MPDSKKNRPRPRPEELERKIILLTSTLEQRDQAVERLERQTEELKTASLETVADYKRRFDGQQKAVAEAMSETAAVVTDRNDKIREFEGRITCLNARLGEKILILREDLRQEKECNAATIAFAFGSSGWRELEPKGVASSAVKDLRHKYEQYRTFYERAVKGLEEGRSEYESLFEEPKAEEVDPSDADASSRITQGIPR